MQVIGSPCTPGFGPCSLTNGSPTGSPVSGSVNVAVNLLTTILLVLLYLTHLAYSVDQKVGVSPLLHIAGTTIWFFWGSAVTVPVPPASSTIASKRAIRLIHIFLLAHAARDVFLIVGTGEEL